MKYQILYILLILTIACNKREGIEPVPDEVNCEDTGCTVDEDFYSVGLLNGACWVPPFIGISPLSEGYITIIFSEPAINGIRGELIFDIDKKMTDLQDTIWLGKPWNGSSLNSAAATYIYWEGTSIAGRFNFEIGTPLTYDDYMLIDYFNADTSVVEGRFQLRFPKRDVNSFVTHAPDSMHIQCGQFRVEKN